MIRTLEYKFIQRASPGPDELFDLVKDPTETVNQAEYPAYAGIRDRLATTLNTWYARHESPAKTGLRVKELPRHNFGSEAWRDGLREGALPPLTCLLWERRRAT